MHAERMADTADVIIAGAGPAGLTLALTLSRYGVTTVLVERRHEVGSRARATGVSSRSMEVFRALGSEHVVRRRQENVPLSIAFSDCVTSEDPLSSCAIAPPDVTRATSPCDAAFVPQDRLEHALRESVAQSPLIELRSGTRLADFRADGQGVRCSVEDVSGGERRSLHGRFLVGADGAASTVRSQAGIGRRVWAGAAPEQFTYAFTAPLWSHIMPRNRHSLYVVVDPARKSSVWPVGEDRWVYADQRAPSGAFDPAEVIRRIQDATGVDDLPVRLGRTGRFSMDCQVAERFTDGAVYLIGDAAHAVAPRGGTGLNSAIQDAFNLGWRLGWFYRGWSDYAAVSRYDAERRPLAIRDAEVASDPLGLMRDMYEELALEQGGRLRHAWLDWGKATSSLDLVGLGLTVLLGPEGETYTGSSSDGVQLHVVDWQVARKLGMAPSGGAVVRPDAVPVAAWSAEPPAWLHRLVTAGGPAELTTL